MESLDGIELFRYSEYEWMSRARDSGWVSKTGVFIKDEQAGIQLRLAEWPSGAVEPMHTHPGTHATTILRGSIEVDGLRLEALDVVVGYGGVPHGPLSFPEGAFILSALQQDLGNHEHVAVEGAEPHPCANPTTSNPWLKGTGGGDRKILVTDVLGRLTITCHRYPSGGPVTNFEPGSFRALMLLSGSASVGVTTLEEWDLLRIHSVDHAEIEVMSGATLLEWSIAN